MYRWRVKYYWKALDKGYNFASDLTWIGGLHTKLWPSKIMRVIILGKWHLGASPVAKHKEYYKGKVVASPKSGPWWVLWVCVCPWFVRAPKCSSYTLTNLLFDLCRFVWVINLLINLPSPRPRAPTRPFTFEMMRMKVRTPTPSPSAIFTFGFTIESIEELGGGSCVVPAFWPILMHFNYHTTTTYAFHS